mmetsp:Transcript_81175/g.180559  ORF Transcript_81175/g.180559 Transcript_81175/m.180559 type:complete len:289 (+) Transcript_81175:126-992(+)
MRSPFSPFVVLTTDIDCETRSVCGGSTWPVAGCMVRRTYLGTAASNTKFVIGPSRELQNLAVTLIEPSPCLWQWKTIFRPALSNATMGGTCCGAAAAGAAAPPLKMSRRPRSAGPAPPGAPPSIAAAAGAGAGAAAAAAAGPASRRSRRSPLPPPPPPTAGAAGLGAWDGVSRRSLRSRRSFAAPPPWAGLAPWPPPLLGGTSSMDESPTSRLSAPAISFSDTGIRSRIPAREESHSDSRSSKNSQERCCRSTCKLHSNLRSAFRIRSNSAGHRVTSLISAAATSACV